MSLSFSFDGREMEVNALRAKVVSAVMRMVAGLYEEPIVMADINSVDEACAALTDKRREPVTCFSCGQERPA